MQSPTQRTPEQMRALAEGNKLQQAAMKEQMSTQKATVEKLGSRVIAGVAAEGVRTTTVIPAGTMGNDRDLTTVRESWYSMEFGELESTYDDPRNGKTTMVTLSLERGSPDPALFQIPADYKIMDQQPPTPSTAAR